MFTELASWPSTVQRFGRANRYAEWKDGADVRWIDLLAEVADHKAAEILSLPYSPNDMKATRERLQMLTDVAPATLPAPGDIDPPRRVIRRKDLDDLFDTDPDLTGFDVDISPYVRDADDTDVRIFWRDLSIAGDTPLRPRAEELCAVSIGSANDWLKKMRKQGRAQVFVLDPQWRRGDERTVATPPNWTRLTHEQGLRPGLTLLADVTAGGYCEDSGFTGIQKDAPSPIREAGEPSIETAEPPDPDAGGEAEGHDEDPWSEIGVPVLLSVHLGHVAAEAEALCDALDVDSDTRVAVVRAARWHDVGKAHDVFQSTMRRGLGDREVEVDLPLAKTVKRSRHERAFFRHELASALALLAHEEWSRNADLIAYLVAAHHGKVRMNLRALPREQPPSNSDRAGVRFARGVWEDDELMSVALGGGEQWAGGRLTLSVMELGWDETTRESWTERTRDLLARFGPFRLAWMETIVRLADWRASAKNGRGTMATFEALTLDGCAPTPLASYLKALGILRLISSDANHVSRRAADPKARGWWENERFHLRTRSRDALCRFFLDDYAPSPIIAPWNGRAGFLEGDAGADSSRAGAELMNAIQCSTCPRFRNMRQTIESLRSNESVSGYDRLRAKEKNLNKALKTLKGDGKSPNGRRVEARQSAERRVQELVAPSSASYDRHPPPCLHRRVLCAFDG